MTIIDPRKHELIAKKFLSLNQKIKRENLTIRYLLPVIIVSGYLLVALIELFKGESLPIILSIFYLSLSYLIIYLLNNENDRPNPTLYNLWLIFGLISFFASGIDILLPLICFSCSIIYTGNCEIFLRRLDYIPKKLNLIVSHYDDTTLLINNLKYLEDRYSWNVTTCLALFVVTLSITALSYILFANSILSFIQLVAGIIMGLAGIYALLKIIYPIKTTEEGSNT